LDSDDSGLPAELRGKDRQAGIKMARRHRRELMLSDGAQVVPRLKQETENFLALCPILN
jgi:hypothetical protein